MRCASSSWPLPPPVSLLGRECYKGILRAVHTSKFNTWLYSSLRFSLISRSARKDTIATMTSSRKDESTTRMMRLSHTLSFELSFLNSSGPALRVLVPAARGRRRQRASSRVARGARVRWDRPRVGVVPITSMKSAKLSTRWRRLKIR